MKYSCVPSLFIFHYTQLYFMYIVTSFLCFTTAFLCIILLFYVSLHHFYVLLYNGLFYWSKFLSGNITVNGREIVDKHKFLMATLLIDEQ
jgi:hypothetical protein